MKTRQLALSLMTALSLTTGNLGTALAAPLRDNGGAQMQIAAKAEARRPDDLQKAAADQQKAANDQQRAADQQKAAGGQQRDTSPQAEPGRPDRDDQGCRAGDTQCESELQRLQQRVDQLRDRIEDRREDRDDRDDDHRDDDDGVQQVIVVEPAISGAPVIGLTVSNGQVARGQTFAVELGSSDNGGVGSMWWWATGTQDPNLTQVHMVDCQGAASCSQAWNVTTDETGTITIHAQSVDTVVPGHESNEAAQQLSVG